MAYWRSKGAPWLGSYTFANLTTTFPAASFSGYTAFASDVGANGNTLRSNGTRWLPVTGRAVLKDVGAGQSSIANSNTIVLQTLLPVGLWQTNDEMEIEFALAKSGTTDSLTLNGYAGTAGTTSDTSLFSATELAAANRVIYAKSTFKLLSATSVQKYSVVTSYGSAQNTALAAPITISSAAANALYLTLAMQSTSTNDTVSIQGGQIVWRTP